MITQSNYVPWRGYFAAIRECDAFVCYDTVQYTDRDWRNRNRIMVDGKPVWLTLPVHGDRSMKINEVTISNPLWFESHLSKLGNAYPHSRNSPTFEWIQQLYRTLEGVDKLSQINFQILTQMCGAMEICTPILRAEEFSHSGSASERLASIAVQLGASTYVTGPAAKNYLVADAFVRNGISVEYLDYARLVTKESAPDEAVPTSILHDILSNSIEAAAESSRFRME